MDTPKPKFIAVITTLHTTAKRPLGFTRDTTIGPFKTALDAELAVLRYHPPKGVVRGASINCVGATETVRVEYLSASEIFRRWQTKVGRYAR